MILLENLCIVQRGQHLNIYTYLFIFLHILIKVSTFRIYLNFLLQ